LIVSFFAISGTGTPLSLSARANSSMSSSMTFGRPPWLPLVAGGDRPFQGLIADVVAVELGGDGEDGEEHGAHATWVVDAGEGWTPVLWSWLDRIITGRVAVQALELVDGEDDFLAGGGLLDVVRQLQRLLRLRPHLTRVEIFSKEDPLAEDTRANGDLRKRDRLRASRGSLATGHL
jgi:hypothetical protein